VSIVTEDLIAFPLKELPILWHVLSASSVTVMQFAHALGRSFPTLVWVPEMRAMATLQQWKTLKSIPIQPGFSEIVFPLQRGYARALFEQIAKPSRRILKQLLSQSEDPQHSVLVCTSPFWAPVAEQWPGPVVYYVTDLTVAYAGLNPTQVRALDRRLCRVADLVCPNSERIATYLKTDADCPSDRMAIIPNATNTTHVRPIFSDQPDPLPSDLAGLQRPVAGVIGNFAGNVDWPLVLEAIDKTPGYSWLFVGPYTMNIADPAQLSARERVISHPRTMFTGLKPYDDLHHYARALDVAVLPYRRIEPTYSGSATRFYEHLAACRPIIATRGVEELHHKEPLLHLIDTASELASAMNRLLTDPQDGLERSRWSVSQDQTWQNRASTMISALDRMLVQSSLELEERSHA
jgi:glycosyltransferase involved in cell wall biosynthesis